MKPERGDQADDPLGDLVSRFDEGGVLGTGEMPRGIETTADLFQVPPASQPREETGHHRVVAILGEMTSDRMTPESFERLV